MLRLDKTSYITCDLKEILQRNCYQTSFIDKFFKKFLGRLHIVKPTLAIMKKRPL